MSKDFDRIRRLPPYVFSEVNRIKAELRSKGEDIIDTIKIFRHKY